MYNAVIKKKGPTSLKKKVVGKKHVCKVSDYEILFSTGLV
jgi:hypothetical protein